MPPRHARALAHLRAADPKLGAWIDEAGACGWRRNAEGSHFDHIARAIVYQQLYDSTKIAAQNQPELNRFRLKGSYRSASSDVISLNAVNIPQGSVVVTAGGVRLVENQDYTVDYNLGRVKIKDFFRAARLEQFNFDVGTKEGVCVTLLDQLASGVVGLLSVA